MKLEKRYHKGERRLLGDKRNLLENSPVRRKVEEREEGGLWAERDKGSLKSLTQQLSQTGLMLPGFLNIYIQSICTTKNGFCNQY